MPLVKLSTKFDGIDPEELVEFLIQRKVFLAPKLLQRLADNFTQHSVRMAADHGEFGDPESLEDVDLHQEHVEWLAVSRAMRRKLYDENGDLLPIKEVKDAMSVSQTLLGNLQKSVEAVYNARRIKLMEEACAEALKEVDPKLQQDFRRILQEKIGHL